MLLVLLNKILIMLFFMSLLNILRHFYYFVQAFFQSTLEEPKKYRLNKLPLILLGVSIAYVFTTIFTGVTI
jgi:hypothetical protein